ncbi:hypothetical protein EB232_15680 [Mesorhizobium sp. NZP2077]|nr:hypothetical protein EB232_15680 [Mesorhizobium sp. NZP2077]QKD20087.1 hypothetical protein HGP13_15480 [Mesorhizobium sp. NZP2077]
MQRGDKVLDVGCGWGEATLEIAKRVGPTGAGGPTIPGLRSPGKSCCAICRR